MSALCTPTKKPVILSLALAMVASIILVGGTGSPAAASGCSVSVVKPWYQQGYVYTGTKVSCNQRKDWIQAQISLLRNGDFKVYNATTCHNERDCTTLARWSNSSGNQRWCGEGRGYSAPPSSGDFEGSDRKCENKGF